MQSFRTATPLEQLAAYLDARMTAWETTLMATAAQLQASLDTLTASFSDFSSDVTITLHHTQQTLAQMQATLDAAVGNDAAQNALIADLQAQLSAMQTGTDAALARIQSLNDAVAAADVAVNQP